MFLINWRYIIRDVHCFLIDTNMYMRVCDLTLKNPQVNFKMFILLNIIIAKQSWERNSKLEFLRILISRHYKTTDINTVWYWNLYSKQINQWSRIKFSEIILKQYGHMIFNNSAKATQWRKFSLFSKRC